MTPLSSASPPWYFPVAGPLLRLAAKGLVPARWFQPYLPGPEARAAKTGALHLEIVSHCWNYAHFLVYQLSSLVCYPPQAGRVTMAVYYSPEDARTQSLLDFFGAMEVPGVAWSWRPLPRRQLFRRAIGRNQAALATTADWIWFTDCDLMFRRDCLNGLMAELQGRRDALVYPKIERVTPLLASLDSRLSMDLHQVLDFDDADFVEHYPSRATGPLQITHGDVARACGYCNSLSYYQQPSEVWCKAYEDRAFRWLLRTHGVPLDIPGVYRIRHIEKGRYTGSKINTWIRTRLRHTMGYIRG